MTSTPMPKVPFDRQTEDLGNIVQFEHVHLGVPDPLLATQFYMSGLGLTRDPYMMTGTDNMWVNAGATQFHLPTRAPQRLRGSITVVIPHREALLERLQRSLAPLAHTAFAFEEAEGFVAVTCPWGNRLRCVEPDTTRFGHTALSIVELALDVPRGSAEGIGRFYRDVFAANVSLDAATGGVPSARVKAGPAQSLVFQETDAPLADYDGHHIQIYVADFSGPHRRLTALGLLSQESSAWQYRCLDIADPATGAPLFRLEHEVRSLTHPLRGRPLINRNPAQTSARYRPGRDAFWP